MKFSLKTLAAAVVMAAAATGASAATIDNGAGGNGGLFFNIWDGASSYTLNLGYSIDSFQSKLAETSAIDLSFAADSTLTSYLASANTASLKWNVLATDAAGARRVLETYSSAPATGSANGNFRTIASAIGSALQGTSSQVNSKLATDNSATFSSSEAGYFGKSSALGINFNGLQNFSNAGTLANNTFASGLNFMRVDALATGVAPAIYNQYLDGTSKVAVYLDSSNALHIQAMPVPEPESYAMLLAGLGMLGFMARRRLNNRV